PSVPKTTKADVSSAGSDALVLIHSLQTTALDSRRRAADAGATNEQLRSGDESNRAAGALITAGKLSDAATKLNDATAAWATAERDARVLASTASVRTRVVTSEPVKADIPTP